MSIKYSDHARKQIKERKIPVNRVNETVKNPERKILSSSNRKLRQSCVKGNSVVKFWK